MRPTRNRPEVASHARFRRQSATCGKAASKNTLGTPLQRRTGRQKANKTPCEGQAPVNIAKRRGASNCGSHGAFTTPANKRAELMELRRVFWTPAVTQGPLSRRTREGAPCVFRAFFFGLVLVEFRVDYLPFIRANFIS